MGEHHQRILGMVADKIRGGPSWSRTECPFCASGRVDLATVEGDDLCGYEIKSDADSLGRLRPPVGNQIAEYGDAFDRVVLVCGPRHRAAVEAMVPPWWGVWVASQDALCVTREAQRNPGDARKRLAGLLWASEARALASAHGLARGARTKYELVQRVSGLDEAPLREALLRGLRSRQWSRVAKRTEVSL
jgi:hypothetical protein